MITKETISADEIGMLEDALPELGKEAKQVTRPKNDVSCWKLVKVYECPQCGELVRDMDDACNHECKT